MSNNDIMDQIKELDSREITLGLAAIKVINESYKTIENRLKARLIELLGAGGRQYATTDSGEEIATVSISKPKPTEAKPVVESARELTAWLMEEEPDAVVMTPADWWLAALPQWIKAHDGELPPGVSLSEPVMREPSVSVRISAQQREALMRLAPQEAKAFLELGVQA